MSNLRTLILNAPPKRVDVPTPFWSQRDEQGIELVDGFVALQDIPASELGKLQTDMAADAMKMAGAILVRALIDKRTGARIFEDADRDAVIGLGSSVLLPVFQQVMEFFGLNPNAVETTKKNFVSQNGAKDWPGFTSVRRAHLVP